MQTCPVIEESISQTVNELRIKNPIRFSAFLMTQPGSNFAHTTDAYLTKKKACAYHLRAKDTATRFGWLVPNLFWNRAKEAHCPKEKDSPWALFKEYITKQIEVI